MGALPRRRGSHGDRATGMRLSASLWNGDLEEAAAERGASFCPQASWSTPFGSFGYTDVPKPSDRSRLAPANLGRSGHLT
jgi:hypothetical protein